LQPQYPASTRDQLQLNADLSRLIDESGRGDAEAFAEIYRRFFPMVRGILLARVPISDLDDLTQEIFLQAWRQLPSLREALAFGGWLAQIARRRAADHFRHAHSSEQLFDDVALAPADEQAWFLLHAIRRLPEAYRETLILRFVEGLTGPEIAELTNLTPDSVRVNLHRGVKLLREHLKGTPR
jgi:RNA polymerase sigma-70 factor (ECF subfamily)